MTQHPDTKQQGRKYTRRNSTKDSRIWKYRLSREISISNCACKHVRWKNNIKSRTGNSTRYELFSALRVQNAPIKSHDSKSLNTHQIVHLVRLIFHLSISRLSATKYCTLNYGGFHEMENGSVAPIAKPEFTGHVTQHIAFFVTLILHDTN